MITRMKPDITTTRRPRRSGAPRLAGRRENALPPAHPADRCRVTAVRRDGR